MIVDDDVSIEGPATIIHCDGPVRAESMHACLQIIYLISSINIQVFISYISFAIVTQHTVCLLKVTYD